MARITTSRGAATLRPMLASEELILADLADAEEKGTPSAFWSLKGRMLRALEAGTEATDWEGGFGALPADETLKCFVLWNNATEEEALPNESAPNSATPQEAGR